MPRSSSRPGGRTRQKGQPSGTALDSGLRLLGQRAHSRLELRRKLARRGFASDDVEAALTHLAGSGYLDDEAFARGLVTRRSPTRGPLALSAELAGKGIERAQAAAAVAEFGPEAQLEAARHLAERLYAKRPVAGYREMLDRVGSKLVRRGFPPRVVMAACAAVLAERREAET